MEDKCYSGKTVVFYLLGVYDSYQEILMFTANQWK